MIILQIGNIFQEKIINKKNIDKIFFFSIYYNEAFLQSLNIKPCAACDFCRTSGTNSCVINDDMKDLYKKISKAKAIILATPVYWFSYSAQLKAFIDRFYGLVLDKNNVLENKDNWGRIYCK